MENEFMTKQTTMFFLQVQLKSIFIQIKSMHLVRAIIFFQRVKNPYKDEGYEINII